MRSLRLILKWMSLYGHSKNSCKPMEWLLMAKSTPRSSLFSLSLFYSELCSEMLGTECSFWCLLFGYFAMKRRWKTSTKLGSCSCWWPSAPSTMVLFTTTSCQFHSPSSGTPNMKLIKSRESMSKRMEKYILSASILFGIKRQIN